MSKHKIINLYLKEVKDNLHNIPVNKLERLKSIVNILSECNCGCNSCTDDLEEEIKARHGSPNFFNCFRVQHIGSGAGSQALGWGLYFQNGWNEGGMATGYAAARNKVLLVGNKTIHELAIEYDNNAFEEIPKSAKNPMDVIEFFNEQMELVNEEIEDINSIIEDEGDSKELQEELKVLQEHINDYQRAISIVENMSIEVLATGYIYNVILHKGKSPSEYDYLHFETVVPQKQLQKIQNQAKIDPLLTPAQRDKILKISSSYNKSGRELYTDITHVFGDAVHYSHNTPETAKSGQKDASLFLKRCGIDGNKSGGAIIVFDDADITILNICDASTGKIIRQNEQ